MHEELVKVKEDQLIANCEKGGPGYKWVSFFKDSRYKCETESPRTTPQRADEPLCLVINLDLMYQLGTTVVMGGINMSLERPELQGSSIGQPGI